MSKSQIFRGPASKLVLKFFLALWCGLIGGLFIFPGFRAARMHYDLLKYVEISYYLFIKVYFSTYCFLIYIWLFLWYLRYYEVNRIRRFLLNISFASPFFLVLLWVKPVCRDYLTVRIFSGMSAPLWVTKCIVYGLIE